MRTSFLPTALLFAATAACTGSPGAPTGATTVDAGPDATTPLPDGVPDAATAADATTDAPNDATPGTSDDASSDASDAGIDSAPNPFMGAIFATSDKTIAPDGGTQLDYSFGAYFAHETAPDQSIVSTTTVGPCVVVVYGNGSGPTDTNESAGTALLAGGKQTLKLAPQADKSYTTVQSATANLWNGGETLTLSADGGDVPPFSTTLVAPSKITLTSPALPSASGSMTVARNAPWTGTWTGSSSGSVVIYFDATDTNNAYATTCRFAASAGTGEVPAAALSGLPAGSGTFNFYVETSAAPTVPGWAIQFNASSQIVNNAGVGAQGSTTYP